MGWDFDFDSKRFAFYKETFYGWVLEIAIGQVSFAVLDGMMCHQNDLQEDKRKCCMVLFHSIHSCPPA
jgi:hypothetical protein